MTENENCERWKAYYSDNPPEKLKSFKERFEEAAKRIEGNHHSLFKSYEVSEDQLEKMNEVRDIFTTAYRAINQVQCCEVTRLGSLVRTKLEEACMYAIKNIAAGGRL